MSDSKNSLLLFYSDARKQKLVFSLLNQLQDLKEQFSLVYDKRLTKDSKWTGLILRNIPHTNSIIENILSSFNRLISKEEEKLTSADVGTPLPIKEKLCCEIFIRGGIEVAEQICQVWHNQTAQDQVLKCHIHPYSCMDRRDDGHPFFHKRRRIV